MEPQVVVVGAGIVGASVAYHAARHGAAVTLVDRARPGSGVTGSSFGWIGRHGRWPGGAAALRADVLPQWWRLETELPGVRVRWTGALSWPVDATVAPLPAGAGDAGGDVELLGAAQVAALEPNLREPPVQALRTRSDGAVDALAVTRALVRGARDHGARVLLGAQVVAVRTGGARVSGVDTSHGPLAADTVVAAAGTGVPRLCAPFGVPVPVVPSPAAVLEFESPRGLVRTLVAGPDVEVRQSTGGRLLAAVDWSQDGAGDGPQRALGRTATAISAVFRGAGGLRPRAVRVGVRPVPADGAPIVGPVPGVPGLYLAVMHSGVTLAPLVGRLVARELVEAVEAEELLGCRPGRFTASA